MKCVTTFTGSQPLASCRRERDEQDPALHKLFTVRSRKKDKGTSNCYSRQNKRQTKTQTNKQTAEVKIKPYRDRVTPAGGQ